MTQQKEFWDELNASQVAELEQLLAGAQNISFFFAWYDANIRYWKHGTQKQFLFWLIDIWSQHHGHEYQYACIKKKYQRFHQSSPERKRRNLQSDFDPISILMCDLRSLGASDDSIALSTLGKRGAEMVDHLLGDVHSQIEKFTTYHFSYGEIKAEGRWTDEDSLSSREYSELARKIPVNFNDEPMRAAKGRFVVLEGSQFRKQPAVSGEKIARIMEERKKLMESDILRDDGNVFVFTCDYVFTSPSQAASVLAGININGRKWWKDEFKKTLGEFRKKKDLKTKRGPGRPRKSS